jgi:hypothetical protein
VGAQMAHRKRNARQSVLGNNVPHFRPESPRL